MGNARTALFSALLAEHYNGTFLLRIEDTDVARSKKEYEESLKQDLHWLGMNWQEGPDVGGSHGPYYQSERDAVYNEYYQKLQDIGRAYPCFCSETQLAVTRKVQLAAGQAPRYPGTCRHLTEAERQEKLAQGIKPTLRFKVPKGEIISFEDGVKGLQKFAADDIGDFIIRRADGGSSFMFCNAIDDSLMGVTHVVRGEDHLTNTPRQLMILEALGMAKPSYAHISMILGSDGAPLSKRNGSRNIQQLREEGYLPAAVENYMARLGHYYESNQFMTFSELAKQFKVESLGKAAARYDEAQLLFWQKTAVLAMDDQAFWNWLGAHTHALVPENKKALFIQTIRDNVLFPKQALAWAKLLFTDHLHLDDEAEKLLAETDKAVFSVAAQTVQQAADFKLISEQVTTQCGVKGKALFQPLRVALTGQMHGPQMAPIVELLGIERCVKRFQQARLETGS
jgi:glutamyl-tRNA synthetase